MIDHISKLSIGAAQIGQAYGLNAAQNNIDINEASKIIALCREIGINNIDTAYSYGHSERILGNVGIGGFNVNSKFSIEDIERQNIHEDKLVDLIEESLRRLKISKLDSLLLHNSKDLFGKNKKTTPAGPQKRLAAAHPGRRGLELRGLTTLLAVHIIVDQRR